eukprot:2403231-Pyramimonas_sp.AAC.3
MTSEVCPFTRCYFQTDLAQRARVATTKRAGGAYSWTVYTGMVASARRAARGSTDGSRQSIVWWKSMRCARLVASAGERGASSAFCNKRYDASVVVDEAKYSVVSAKGQTVIYGTSNLGGWLSW